MGIDGSTVGTEYCNYPSNDESHVLIGRKASEVAAG